MLIGSNPSEHDSISVSACGVLYRTSIIIQHSLSFKSEREYISEDLLFNIEYINHCRSIVLLDICGYYYRMNQNSLTTSYRKDRFTKTKYIYEVQKEMLINIGVYEQCKYRLMKQFFIYLRLCISQENTKLSNLHINDAIRHISTICHDTLVGKLIDEYPVYKLGIRQQIYIRLIKAKQSLILYLLVLLKKI